mmetsp:Transcript_8835/g.26448  ORF Transcript_8835/g.26448 Transcript_8835/m.26448 type:complete len:204 (+) Transcript_8835:197-808(+)
MSKTCPGLISALQDSLDKLHELEITIEDCCGDTELLVGRLDGLLESLGALHGKSSEAAFDVPLDLIKFVDAGGSPDVFLGGVTRTALSDNQAAAGKVAALGAFREEILKQAAAAFPEDTAAYLALAAPRPTLNPPAATADPSPPSGPPSSVGPAAAATDRATAAPVAAAAAAAASEPSAPSPHPPAAVVSAGSADGGVTESAQ